MNQGGHPNNIYVDHYVKFLMINLAIAVNFFFSPDFNFTNKFRFTVERSSCITWGH
jgi:hypothetical protein